MTSLFELVVHYFSSDGWPVELVDSEEALTTAFRGESGQWTCYARVYAATEQFIFYSLCPVTVPPSHRQAAAEYLTRANYGMVLGNFELDFSDGEVRYKTSVDVEGDQLSLALIQRVVVPNVMMMDRYLPGLLSVVYGEVSPAQAIAQIEQN